MTPSASEDQMGGIGSTHIDFKDVALIIWQRSILFVIVYWRTLTVILTPIVLLPIPLSNQDQASRCLYLFCIMAVYWVSDAIPTCVTSLMPIFFCPMLGLMSSSHVCQIYMRDGIVIAIGAMMFAIALEYSGLHYRLALKLMQISNCAHSRLSFMLFFSTMFVSMWMANTIACAMFLPIVKAILEKMETLNLAQMYKWIGTERAYIERHEDRKLIPTDVTVFYYLGIAYSAAIGGIGTIVGSKSNIVFKTFIESLFPSSPEVLFPKFMLHNLPLMLAIEFLIYLWMNFLYNGMFRSNRGKHEHVIRDKGEELVLRTVLAAEYEQLGKISHHEYVVGFLFIMSILLHSFRNPGYIVGWGNVNGYLNIKASAPAMFIIFLLFLIPKDLMFLKYFKKLDGDKNLVLKASQSCLSWRLLIDRVPWDVIFTLGGACAIIECMKYSKLSVKLGQGLAGLSECPTFVCVLSVVVVSQAVTQFAPSANVSYVLLPVMADLAVQLKIHPQLLMLASLLGCSYSFHLPVASPSMAVVAAYGYITPQRMMIAGLGPSFIALILTWFCCCLWAPVIWPGMAVFPAWAFKLETNFSRAEMFNTTFHYG